MTPTWTEILTENPSQIFVYNLRSYLKSISLEIWKGPGNEVEIVTSRVEQR